MALFTKKKFSDAERQAWSAQLLEVRAAELDRYGDQPTLGDTWEAHDAEYNRLYALVYAPKYGLVGGPVEMKNDGLRLSGYRKFVEGESMLVIQTELDDPPSAWGKSEVYWITNTGELDDDGDQIWGYQFVASEWKYAKSEMSSKVKDWDLVNQRKGLFLDAWNRYWKIIAAAILVIALVIALVPIVGGIALGVVLGETISISGALSAIGAGAGGALATWNRWTSPLSAFFEDIAPEVDEFFVDSIGQLGGAELVPQVPVFQPDGNIVLELNAPTNPAALQSRDGFETLLLAASALFLIL